MAKRRKIKPFCRVVLCLFEIICACMRGPRPFQTFFPSIRMLLLLLLSLQLCCLNVFVRQMNLEFKFYFMLSLFFAHLHTHTLSLSIYVPSYAIFLNNCMRVCLSICVFEHYSMRQKAYSSFLHVILYIFFLICLCVYVR